MRLGFIIQGMRPKTLAAAIVPPLLAWAFAFGQGQPSTVYIFLCIALALFIQIATNFYNDGVDALKGADIERVGPARLATQEKISPRKVIWIGHVFVAAALFVAIPIFYRGGIPFIILGLLSAYLSYGYTGGPFPLAYLGLGELFVFLFFGLVATVGSYFLNTGEINGNIFIVGSIVGLLSTVLIAINNYRDRKSDIKVNKRTLATRLSDQGYLALMDAFLFLPYVLAMYLVIFVKLSYFAVFLCITFAHRIRVMMREERDLNLALALGGKQLIIFMILFWIASLWNSNIATTY